MHRSNVAVFFSLGEGKHESQCKDDIDACRFNVFLFWMIGILGKPPL